MGIRISAEVWDHWQDHKLTKGERDDLLLLAENADDKTRLTFGSLMQPYMLRRIGKEDTSWKSTLSRLARKGLIESVVRGHNGAAAVYRIAVLCPEPPHWGQQGMCTKPVDGEMGTAPRNPTSFTDVDGLHGTRSWVARETELGCAASNPYSPDSPDSYGYPPYPPSHDEPHPSADAEAAAETDSSNTDEQIAHAVDFLTDLPDDWSRSKRQALEIAPLLLHHATRTGWLPNTELVAELTRPIKGGVQNHGALLHTRIKSLRTYTPPKPGRRGGAAAPIADSEALENLTLEGIFGS